MPQAGMNSAFGAKQLRRVGPSTHCPPNVVRPKSNTRKRPRAAQLALSGTVSRKPKGESVGLRGCEWPKKPTDQKSSTRNKNETNTNLIQHVSVIALLALMVGCATTATFPQDKANMLVAAGFKTVTPRTPAQQQKLQQLQTGQVVTVQKNGRTYYIVANPSQNVVYVGGPHEYQAYQQMRAQRQLAQENLQTAEVYQDAAMQWDTWGGWGMGWGRMGYGVGVGRVGGVGRF